MRIYKIQIKKINNSNEMNKIWNRNEILHNMNEKGHTFCNVFKP